MSWKRNDLPSPNATSASSTAPRRRPVARTILLGLALGAALLNAGCSSRRSGEAAGTAAVLTGSEPECPVTVDLGDWQHFRALAERTLSPGGTVGVDEWSALLDRPGFLAWRESYRTDDSAPKTPMPRRHLGEDAELNRPAPQSPLTEQLAQVDLPTDKAFVIAAIGNIFDRSAGAEGRATGSGIGNALRLEYNYALEHADRIAANAAELTAPETSCALWQMLRRWIDADRLPASVNLLILPMDRQFVQQDDRIIVGTNVLAAGHPAQLIRQLAGLYYQQRQAIAGPDPQLVTGEEVIAQLCRLLVNQGVKGHLTDVVKAHYDARHPRLGDFNPIPESFYERGAWLIEVCNTNLPGLLTNPADMDRLAEGFITMVRQLNAINMGSYCMAETIVARLGPERLHASRNSVAGFLRAYQEAARSNPLPLARPGEVGRPYHECMPAFDDAVFTDLLALVQRYFPEG